jgi:hypothetical protein
MSAYFQDVRSSVVLRFDGAYDIKSLREQVGDYKEVSEDVFNAYLSLLGQEPVKTKKSKE